MRTEVPASPNSRNGVALFVAHKKQARSRGMRLQIWPRKISTVAQCAVRLNASGLGHRVDLGAVRGIAEIGQPPVLLDSAQERVVVVGLVAHEATRAISRHHDGWDKAATVLARWIRAERAHPDLAVRRSARIQELIAVGQERRVAASSGRLPAVTLLLAPLGQFLAPLRGVRPDLLQPWHEVGKPVQELASADRVVDIGGGDVAGNRQTQGVNQKGGVSCP